MVSKNIRRIITGSQKWEVLFSAVHIDALALLLVLQSFGMITMDITLFKGLTLWIAFNLAAFPVARKRFVTPSIASPKCNFCGSYMTTSELICEKCHARSLAYKDNTLKNE
jgi:hypothetical protein